MTRRYEIVYIFDSALEEQQINAALDRHQALLKPDGASEFILETNHWGRRTLAYSIGNHEVGYYVVVNLKTTGDKLGEFERSLKLDESVIRYLIILNEGEIPVPIPPPSESDRKKDDDEPRRKPESSDSEKKKPESSDSEKKPESTDSEKKPESTDSEQEPAKAASTSGSDASSGEESKE